MKYDMADIIVHPVTNDQDKKGMRATYTRNGAYAESFNGSSLSTDKHLALQKLITFLDCAPERVEPLAITAETYQEHMNKFLAGCTNYMDEYYSTERDFANIFLKRFFEETFCIDKEKEARKAQYLKLKEEFENED